VLGVASSSPLSDQPDDRGSWTASLPPPPEVAHSSGSSLLWTAPATRRSQEVSARHPLLLVASAFPGSSSQPERAPSRLGRILGAAVRRGAGSPWRADHRGHTTALNVENEPGQPVVVAISGGRGGCGRTRLAIELATALAAGELGQPRRVLLVDADSSNPDLDLQLGITDLDSDQRSRARIDRILLHFPELADRRTSLESLLWVDPRSGLRGLLAPDLASAVSREQLDYLYTYFLAPAFDAIVVDTGPTLGSELAPLTAAPAYWLSMAHAVLIPLRPSLSGVRAAVDAVRLAEALGVARDHCRLVMGVAKNEVRQAADCQRRLSDLAVVRWPWVPDLARQAAVDRRPLADRDRRFAKSIATLLYEVVACRRRRS
jgi:MinD-like ATPase involved in chromosome partitioning or flagellar assembly